MGLHCILIVKPQISGNWKKQLQHTGVLVISFKDQFKSEKVNHFHESSGLTSYNVYNPKEVRYGIRDKLWSCFRAIE